MAKAAIETKKLLTDRRVVEEIQRHLWFESEKVGHDIGFATAQEDWLKNFSKAWMQYHMPEEVVKTRKTTGSKKPASKSTKVKKATTPKRRRAKSYLN